MEEKTDAKLDEMLKHIYGFYYFYYGLTAITGFLIYPGIIILTKPFLGESKAVGFTTICLGFALSALIHEFPVRFITNGIIGAKFGNVLLKPTLEWIAEHWIRIFVIGLAVGVCFVLCFMLAHMYIFHNYSAVYVSVPLSITLGMILFKFFIKKLLIKDAKELFYKN